MRRDVTIERTYSHPPEKLWRALTDRQALAQWLMACDFEPKVGHTFQFREPNPKGWRGIVDCKVLEVDPPRRLSYSWLGDPSWKEPTVVTWTLEPIAGGTRLRLEHSNFLGLGGVALSFILGSGWKHMLRDKFPAALERAGGKPGV